MMLAGNKEMEQKPMHGRSQKLVVVQFGLRETSVKREILRYA